MLSLTLVGSGAAYAGYQQWYAGGGADGLSCFTRWVDPLVSEQCPADVA